MLMGGYWPLLENHLTNNPFLSSRDFPILNFERQAKKLSLQHLEFNFIQFVVYPQRLKEMKKRVANNR